MNIKPVVLVTSTSELPSGFVAVATIPVGQVRSLDGSDWERLKRSLVVATCIQPGKQGPDIARLEENTRLPVHLL